MRLKTISLALSLFCATAQGYCESDLNSRVSQLESDMNKVRGQTALGNFGAKTAYGFPQIDGYGIFATAEFLWWKLYGFQTDYVLNNKPDSTLFKGHIDPMRFHWEPGFRVGLGYIFDYEGWDVSLNFTDYSTRAHHHTKAHLGDTAYLLWGWLQPANKISAKWHIDFYNLDLSLGRNYFVSKYLSLHPSFGLATAWIRQHRGAHLLIAQDHIKLDGKNNFWGIGPKLGLNAQFFLGRNFSIYGNFSGALLWGDFKVKEKEYSTNFNFTFYNQNLDTQRMAPTVDFAIGAAYETNFNDNCNHFRVKVGYENQYWWKQNQFPYINQTTQSQKRISDDLGMQGLTIDFRLDF